VVHDNNINELEKFESYLRGIVYIYLAKANSIVSDYPNNIKGLGDSFRQVPALEITDLLDGVLAVQYLSCFIPFLVE